MKHHHPIQSLLTAWGRAARELPFRNDELKHSVLAKFERMPKHVSPAPHRLPWFSFVFTGLAILALFITSGTVRTVQEVALPQVSVPSATQNKINSETLVPLSQKSASYYPHSLSPEPQVPVTDNREFLKTDYRATLRTRHVQDLTGRIQTTVRGFDGRVDNVSDSPRWGSVSFVVPASKFEAFRREIESFAPARFFTEEILTENLLPQKQSIEEEQKTFGTALAQLRDDRGKLAVGHNRTADDLESQLTSLTYELVFLRAETSTDPARRAYIAAREREILNEQETLNTRLADENAAYATQINSLDLKIRGIESELARTNAQDQKLLDTVATVRGTISLSWISVWEIIDLYFSPYWASIFFALTAVVFYVIYRRRNRFVIPGEEF